MPQLQNHQAQRRRTRDLQQGSAPQAAAGVRAMATNRVPAPWALRVIGRRGLLMRHAALQTLAVEAGATLDVARVPRAARVVATSSPQMAEVPAETSGRAGILVEN
jgi:hypothetical protein